MLGMMMHIRGVSAAPIAEKNMARLTATITDQQNAAVEEMASEYGLSSSEVVKEAISMFMQVVVEAKRGRRLMMVDESHKRPAVAITTQMLTSMDWTQHKHQIDLSPKDFEAVQKMIDSPAEPTDALREAMASRRPR